MQKHFLETSSSFSREINSPIEIRVRPFFSRSGKFELIRNDGWGVCWRREELDGRVGYSIVMARVLHSQVDGCHPQGRAPFVPPAFWRFTPTQRDRLRIDGTMDPGYMYTPIVPFNSRLGTNSIVSPVIACWPRCRELSPPFVYCPTRSPKGLEKFIRCFGRGFW